MTGQEFFGLAKFGEKTTRFPVFVGKKDFGRWHKENLEADMSKRRHSPGQVEARQDSHIG
jgi:hypothetical protein